MKDFDWKVLQETLDHVFGDALLWDGEHFLQIQRGLVKNRLVYTVWIDGHWSGRWLDENSEIGQKYWRPVRPKVPQEVRRIFGKRVYEKRKKEYRNRVMYYTDDFGSFRTLKGVLGKLEKLEIANINDPDWKAKYDRAYDTMAKEIDSLTEKENENGKQTATT